MSARCPGCGDQHDSAEVVCTICWGRVPAKYRRAVHTAQKDLGYNPASPRNQAALQQAIADALGAIQ